MISFIICLALLIGGYFVYGKVVENTFAPDDRETPAVRINDGVDYVVMPQWKRADCAAGPPCGTDAAGRYLCGFCLLPEIRRIVAYCGAEK